MRAPPAGPEPGGTRLLGGLARWIVRHPWYPIAFWVIALVVSLPFLSLVGSVTTNSAQTTQPNSPSAMANSELARLFPNTTIGDASSTVLLIGPNLTDAAAQRVVENVTGALDADRSLTNVGSVSSVYTAFGGYLTGEAAIAIGILRAGVIGPLSVPVAVSDSVALFWAPPSIYVREWQGLVANGTPAPAANYPAYEETAGALRNESGNSTPALAVLGAFYDGSGSAPGFNSSRGCWTAPASVVACSEAEGSISMT